MVTLNKNDYDNILTMLNVLAEKGFFKPEMFIIVGELYNKLIILKNSGNEQVKNED